ncbi:FAD-dependent oxidoreductase [Streptomyces sp. NPDC006458]|uniref:NAD(P)/FAD-dependent oxidoreductase n=1 Tax=Streptomyces sp. NPDC006458 TaxID=3154302 RepID=UPI0033BEB7FA
MTQNAQVLVIGGGYAGVMAANRLTQRDDLRVTLINPRPNFVHRIRLHQVATGKPEAVVDYAQVLSDRVHRVVDTVTRIDAAGRKVTLAEGGSADYDYLIYAVGSSSGDPEVPGAAEFAHPAATLEEAQRLCSVLDSTSATAAVTVVGAGPFGIEFAGELAEAGRRVTLVCGGVLGPYLHPRVRRTFAKRLARLGVRVLEGPETRVTSVSRDAVRLADGRELASDVTVWAAGFGVPDLATRSGLSTDTHGRLLTDETLTSMDDSRIIAAGDAVAPSDLPLRMSCQAANPLGAHAADTVLSRLDGKQPALIDVGFFGMCISVGQAATVQLASKDDRANGFSIGGFLGWKVKRTSFPILLRHLAHEARKPGSYSWKFKDATRRERVRAKHDATVAGRVGQRGDRGAGAGPGLLG